MVSLDNDDFPVEVAVPSETAAVIVSQVKTRVERMIADYEAMFAD